MRNSGVHPRGADDDLPAGDLQAGDFSSWLRRMRDALMFDEGTEVDCDGCSACCDSSYFIHIRPDETRTLRRIPEDLPASAPGMPAGHLLLGYDETGRCPMLSGPYCSIYDVRPQTCRNYDCRVFAAAGIEAGGADKARITARARRWRFGYPTRADREGHAAVRAAAAFVRDHAEHFPGGRVPSEPSQLAIVAVKAYGVFVRSEGDGAPEPPSSPAEMAHAVVEACREFDAAGDGG